MKHLHIIVCVYIAVCSLVGFIAMCIDKSAACKGQYRIPERTLFTIAGIGGALGVLSGMYVLKHKTRHLKFTIGIPLLLVLNAAAVFLVFCFL